jgi:dolichol-phosphate mannosyltransferase
MRVSILVPVYNNAPHLRELHRRLALAFEPLADTELELLLVDDGSADASWETIGEIAASDPRVKGLVLSRNFGQHAAISAALEHATGDALVLMDADLQDRPEHVPLLLAQLAGVDVVYTVKVGAREPWLTRATSRMFHHFVSAATGSFRVDHIGTFRCFTRQVADALLQYRERAIVYGPLMHSLGYRIRFVELERDAREGSGSSYTFARRMKLALQSLISYTTIPQKALMFAGAGLFAAATLYLVSTIVQYFAFGAQLPSGTTLLIVLNLAILGVVVGGIGILAVYVFMIHREVLARPRYLVRQTLNLDTSSEGRR